MTDNRKLDTDELKRPSAKENLNTPKRPITLVLDNIRSGLNVGSIIRSADGFGVSEVILCGITAQPPDRQVLKAAIGAESSIHWRYEADAYKALKELKATHQLVVVEQTLRSIPLNDLQWSGSTPVAVVLGNELRGVDESLLELADSCVDVPQIGHKHSLNVAVCAGIVLWELCRDSGG